MPRGWGGRLLSPYIYMLRTREQGEVSLGAFGLSTRFQAPFPTGLIVVADEPHRDRVEHAEPIGFAPPGLRGFLPIIHAEPREPVGDLSRDSEPRRAAGSADESPHGRRRVASHLDAFLFSERADCGHEPTQRPAAFALGEVGRLEREEVWPMATDPQAEHPLGLGVDRADLSDVLDVGPVEFAADEECDPHVPGAGIDGEDPHGRRGNLGQVPYASCEGRGVHRCLGPFGVSEEAGS
jgi:hypothetical protein